MDGGGMIHMRPTLEMLAEDLRRRGIECRAAGGGGARFCEARRWAGKAEIAPGVLWVGAPGEAADLPTGQCAFAGMGPVGAAGAILSECPPERLLGGLLALFSEYRAMETRLDELVFENVSLDALCEQGAALMENPICIHDDWFVMIARSAELEQVMPPEYIMASTKAFIPQIIMDDFKNDSEYLETYTHRSARVWNDSSGQPPTLYVNLWEGSVYRGRLLVVRHHRDFLLQDFLLAELLAQRAMALLGRKHLGYDRPHRGMDDIVYDLLRGRQVESLEEGQLSNLLNLRRGDRLVCVRVERQQAESGTLLEHALHSDLFRAFPRGYVMFADGQQCVVLNATLERLTTARLSHRLAPLCRDYLLYAGISSPVDGLRELGFANEQASIALSRAFRLRSERWVVPFSDCALEYMMGQLPASMPLPRLAAPELTLLKEHDAEKDTQYYETLRAYLLNERDIPRTSAALIIHRTTLLYRLKKIQELISLDLDDPWRRLYLLLSLWILEQ